MFKIACILYIIMGKYYDHSTSILGSNHPKPLQDINVNTSHHVCTNILTVTTSSAGISHIATSVELLEVKNNFFLYLNAYDIEKLLHHHIEIIN